MGRRRSFALLVKAALLATALLACVATEALAATLTGTVTARVSGAPIAGATVGVYSSGGVLLQTTSANSTGFYFFSGLPAGAYYVRTLNTLQPGAGFSNQPYMDQLYWPGLNRECTVGCPVTTGWPIQVTDVSLVTLIDFALSIGGRISGTVKDAATGAAVPNFPVDVYSYTTGQFVQTTWTTAGYGTIEPGFYAVTGLVGQYYVRTNGSGTLVNQLYNGIPCISCDVTTSGGTLVTVAAGTTRTGIDFRLAPNQPPAAKIAFDSDRDGDTEIFVMDLDGSNQQQLTFNSATDRAAHWSPDRTKIVFQSERDGDSEVVLMNADGSAQVALTDNPANDTSPSWSPDGSKLLFASDRDGNLEIYSMNADGSGQTRLTTNGASDNEPEWSPDGSKILFYSDRDGDSEVFVMNVDGTGQTQLTFNSSTNDVQPEWSPDGLKIVFARGPFGTQELEIWVMNAGGTGQAQLTFDAAVDNVPSFSPDGNRILFSSDRDGDAEVFVMNADGSSQAPLTSNTASDFLPDWQPGAVPPAPISRWRAENNALDSIGGNHGALENGATFGSGRAGAAFSFDGVDDQVTVPHNANLNTRTQITIAAWVNPASDGHGRPIAQKRSPGNAGGYTLETTSAYGLQWVVWINGNPYILQTSQGVLQPDTWQHVAGTFDGIWMRILVNGVEKASVEFPGAIDVAPGDPPFVIGRNVVINSFAWHGLIDELEIYGRALTAAEILSTFPPAMDGDGDGVSDALDNCPLTSNSDQGNADGDGVGDACDADDDNDGVADAGDNCHFSPNPDQTNTDGDAFGDACDADDDNDVVADISDNCPLISNFGQADLDGDGIGNACDPDFHGGPGTISGTVRRRIDGTPIPGATVGVYDSGGVLLQLVSANFSGNYSVFVPAGSYYMRTIISFAFDPVGYVDQLYRIGQSINCHLGWPLTTGSAIAMNGESVTGIDFSLDIGGGISGTVKNALTGAVVPVFSVELYSSTGVLVSRVNTSATGVYRFTGLIGQYYVRTDPSNALVSHLYNGVICIGCNVTTSSGTLVAATAGATTAGIDFNLVPDGPDADRDGIDNAIDRGLDGSSQAVTPSNGFNDGITAGVIARRVPKQTVSVSDLPGVAGVHVEIEPLGSCNYLSREGCTFDSTNSVQLVICGGDKRVTFHDAVVDLTCQGSTATVTAVQAALTKGGALFERLYVGGRIKVVARLTTGQTVSAGSPFTAASSNTEPITAQMVDGNDRIGATLDLDPGESVDLSVDEQPDGGTTVSATLLHGDVAMTVFGQTHTLTLGETSTFTLDTTRPTISVVPGMTELWPPNGKLVPVVISGMMIDSASGIDPATARFRVVDEYGAFQPTGAVVVAPDGRFSVSVPLEARRRGEDLDGRRYEVIVVAADKSGNEASASALIVVPRDQRR